MDRGRDDVPSENAVLVAVVDVAATMDTLSSHAIGPRLVPPDAPSSGAFARRTPLEVLALRHQLQVLQRTRPRRVRLAKTDRCLWVVLAPLDGMANGARHRQAGDRHRLAPNRASGCGGPGRAGAAWGDRLCQPTSARRFARRRQSRAGARRGFMANC